MDTLTARQIVQNFKNLYEGGRQTDDVRMSDRQWLFNLDHHRAQLLRQQVEKGQRINEANIQTLGKPDKNKQQVVAFPKTGCKWYSTPLPAAVECYEDNLITYVGTTCGKAFQKTTAQKAYWDEYAKYTGKEPKWYQLGAIMHLVSPPSPSLNYLVIRGVFENPREVLVFNGEELDETDYLNFPYPISRTALDTLTKMLIDGELRLLTSMPHDKDNNSVENHD